MPVQPGFQRQCGESGAYARRVSGCAFHSNDEAVSEMRTLGAIVALALAASPVLAQTPTQTPAPAPTQTPTQAPTQAPTPTPTQTQTQTQRKDCGELKTEIETKIRNNGEKVFTLAVVGKDTAEDGKVVGTCDGGTNKIVYKRGVAEAPRETTGEAKPQPK